MLVPLPLVGTGTELEVTSAAPATSAPGTAVGCSIDLALGGARLALFVPGRVGSGVCGW